MQRRQTGLVSSHLTLRFLQVKQPKEELELHTDRLAWLVFMQCGASTRMKLGYIPVTAFGNHVRFRVEVRMTASGALFRLLMIDGRGWSELSELGSNAVDLLEPALRSRTLA